MTVGGFLAVSAAVRFAACVMLTLLTCAASFFLKKLLPTLFAVASVTLLPYALVYIGFLDVMYIDFTAALAGGKLLLRSAELTAGGGAFTFAWALLLGYAALTAAAAMLVRHKTGR